MAFSLPSLLLLCVVLTQAFARPPTHKKVNDCPRGWTRLGCNCYIYQEDKRCFSDAEKVCNILGGNLVSIHSALENAVVLELIKIGTVVPDTSWIGLHDAINSDDDFIWTDGTLEDFDNFLSGQPDGNGNCVEMDDSGGGWGDASCEDLLSYVCSKEAHVW
ncbi:galactose-specific lectin nattectin-like [Stigmatopora nigra]